MNLAVSIREFVGGGIAGIVSMLFLVLASFSALKYWGNK